MIKLLDYINLHKEEMKNNEMYYAYIDTVVMNVSKGSYRPIKFVIRYNRDIDDYIVAWSDAYRQRFKLLPDHLKNYPVNPDKFRILKYQDFAKRKKSDILFYLKNNDKFLDELKTVREEYLGKTVVVNLQTIGCVVGLMAGENDYYYIVFDKFMEMHLISTVGRLDVTSKKIKTTSQCKKRVEELNNNGYEPVVLDIWNGTMHLDKEFIKLRREIKQKREQDIYVTHRQAKRLKALGFDWKCNAFYSKVSNNIRKRKVAFNFNSNDTQKRSHNGISSAPTLAMAQKWLREKYEIIVLVEVCYKNYMQNDFSVLEYEYVVVNHPCGARRTSSRVTDNLLFNTYEQALSSGIDRSLTLIETKND